MLRTVTTHFINNNVVSPSLPQPRGEPRFRALFDRWFELDAMRKGGCPFMAASHELDDRSGRLRDALVSVQKDWVDTLAKAVRIAVEEGHFRSDLYIDQMAFEIYGVAKEGYELGEDQCFVSFVQNLGELRYQSLRLGARLASPRIVDESGMAGGLSQAQQPLDNH